MRRYAVLAALISGAIHDINHDGYNNAFHVATGSSLAMTYNDKSCLESMHASIGLQLLRHPANDILEHMSLDQKKKFRTLSVDMIMGTDLAHHFEGLSQIQVKAAEGFKLCGENSDLALFLSNIVHAADLGSTAQRPDVYFEWMQVRPPPPPPPPRPPRPHTLTVPRPSARRSASSTSSFIKATRRGFSG